MILHLFLRMQRKTLAHHKLRHFWHFPEALQKYFFFPAERRQKAKWQDICWESWDDDSLAGEEGRQQVCVNQDCCCSAGGCCLPKAHVIPLQGASPPWCCPLGQGSGFWLPEHCGVTLPFTFYSTAPLPSLQPGLVLAITFFSPSLWRGFAVGVFCAWVGILFAFLVLDRLFPSSFKWSTLGKGFHHAFKIAKRSTLPVF